jgi:hypothetical protein
MEPRDKPHRIIRDGRRQLPEMNADLRLARVCQFSREIFNLKMLSEFRARSSPTACLPDCFEGAAYF